MGNWFTNLFSSSGKGDSHAAAAPATQTVAAAPQTQPISNECKVAVQTALKNNNNQVPMAMADVISGGSCPSHVGTSRPDFVKIAKT